MIQYVWISISVLSLLAFGLVHRFQYDGNIAKRGKLNLFIFILCSWCCVIENSFLLRDFEGLYLSIPCAPHLLINYICAGHIFGFYLMKSGSLINEKHRLVMQTKVNWIMYMVNLSWLERWIIGAKTLEKKLEGKTNIAVLQEHFNERKWFSPEYRLGVSSVLFGGNLVLSIIILCIQFDKWINPFCYIEMYIPLYALYGVCIILAYHSAWLLRYTEDPYGLKLEFIIQFCFITPILYIAGFITRSVGLDWAWCIIAAFSSKIVVSVLMPCYAAYKNASTVAKDAKLPLTIEQLRTIAIERFCVELVDFKNDYYNMLAATTEMDFKSAGDHLFLTYISEKAPDQININHLLLQRATKAYHSDKDYFEVYQEIDKAVNELLKTNLSL